ncbi:MAG TPA: zf-HC2 domain-containing protein [Polyangiaceae bacterium]|nr:zf-HC2 domain-containing protein [Polyangiaceae bacterium]
MSCGAPIAWPELVAYWAGDLAPGEVDRLDEHLLSCAACSAESARVAAVAQAVRVFIPPVISREMLSTLRARGTRLVEHTFLPGQRQSVVFRRDLELLIHRLTGLDLSHAERVGLSVRVESTGQVLSEDPDIPFDAEEGVLIACQRHFAALPPDVLFEVRAVSASGAEQSAIYLVPHVYE